MDTAWCLLCLGGGPPSISILKFYSHSFIVRFKPLIQSLFERVPEWAESAGGRGGHCMQGRADWALAKQEARVSRDWPGSE